MQVAIAEAASQLEVEKLTKERDDLQAEVARYQQATTTQHTTEQKIKRLENMVVKSNCSEITAR